MGNPWRSYGASLAIWDHTVLPATRHKWTRPAITPAKQAGTRFTYPGGMEGWVDLGSPIAAGPGIEPTTARSQVRRHNRYATDSPRSATFGCGAYLRFIVLSRQWTYAYEQRTASLPSAAVSCLPRYWIVITLKPISQLRFDYDTTAIRLRRKIDMFIFCSRRFASNGSRRARYVVVGS